MQDLSYVYDPVGNITSIGDAAQQTIYFRNQVVRANGEYVYDAVYRLIAAAGREHAGSPQRPETSYDDAGRVRLPLPGDGHAMQRYREEYRYDAVGNILELIHAAPGDAGWRRKYDYDASDANNRLGTTRVGPTVDDYDYDAHGNMTRMRHLPLMRWDFKDQLAATRTQIVNDGGDAPTTHYVYDAAGERARKVTDDRSGRRRCERIYLAGFEIYREYGGGAVTLERTTLHVVDGTRRVALVESSDDATTIRYQYDNNIGSACLELDETAAVITYEEYYPYGSTSYQAGRSLAEVSLKRYRFTARERDEETGFSYHGARYYAPWLGRWVSCDPIGIAGGINLYSYASASPLCLVDQNGTASAPAHPEDTDIHQFWPSKDPAPDDPEPTPPSHSGDSKPGFFATVWNWVKNAASSVWNWIQGAASSAWHATTQAVSSAWNWTKQAASSAWNWTKNVASSAWNWIQGAASSAWNWTKGAASSAWNWTKGAASSAWNATKSAVTTAWNATKSAVTTAWRWTRGAAAAAATWLKNAASTVWDSTVFRIIAHLTWGSFGTALGGAGNDIQSDGRQCGHGRT